MPGELQGGRGLPSCRLCAINLPMAECNDHLAYALCTVHGCWFSPWCLTCAALPGRLRSKQGL
jgi:hypothetical protein